MRHIPAPHRSIFQAAKVLGSEVARLSDVVFPDGITGGEGTGIGAPAVLGFWAKILAVDLSTMPASYSYQALQGAALPNLFENMTSGLVGITPGQAQAATGTAVLSGSGAVVGITVTNGGSGYTSPPGVYIDPPNRPTLALGGVQATATAVLTGNAVSSVNMGNGGAGYFTTPPIVTFGGGPYFPAYEVNGSNAVPAGMIVWMVYAEASASMIFWCPVEELTVVTDVECINNQIVTTTQTVLVLNP